MTPADMMLKISRLETALCEAHEKNEKLLEALVSVRHCALELDLDADNLFEEADEILNRIYEIAKEAIHGN